MFHISIFSQFDTFRNVLDRIDAFLTGNIFLNVLNVSKSSILMVPLMAVGYYSPFD